MSDRDVVTDRIRILEDLEQRLKGIIEGQSPNGSSAIYSCTVKEVLMVPALPSSIKTPGIAVADLGTTFEPTASLGAFGTKWRLGLMLVTKGDNSRNEKSAIGWRRVEVLFFNVLRALAPEACQAGSSAVDWHPDSYITENEAENCTIGWLELSISMPINATI